MPRYDYDCAACGHRFEVVHGVHADGPTVCPSCGGGPVTKAISAAAVHFKGSGWAKKERRAPAASGTSKTATEGASTATGSTSTGDGGTPEASGAATSDAAPPPPSKSAEAGATSTTD